MREKDKEKGIQIEIDQVFVTLDAYCLADNKI